MKINKPEQHNKVWGFELWIANNDLYCGKILHVNKGHQCSYHYHEKKDETFSVLSGQIIMAVEGEKAFTMSVGDTIRIRPGVKHSFEGLFDSDILEISTQHFEDDSYRLTESK